MKECNNNLRKLKKFKKNLLMNKKLKKRTLNKMIKKIPMKINKRNQNILIIIFLVNTFKNDFFKYIKMYGY